MTASESRVRAMVTNSRSNSEPSSECAPIYSMYSPLALLAKKFLAADFDSAFSNTLARLNLSRIVRTSFEAPSESMINNPKFLYVWEEIDCRQICNSRKSTSRASGNVIETSGSWPIVFCIFGAILAHGTPTRNPDYLGAPIRDLKDW